MRVNPEFLWTRLKKQTQSRTIGSLSTSECDSTRQGLSGEQLTNTVRMAEESESIKRLKLKKIRMNQIFMVLKRSNKKVKRDKPFTHKGLHKYARQDSNLRPSV
ncbi:MAG: hypothetical protein ACYS3S_15535 [Planctomycetota bacterium]|jgi:hypothetical protein